MSQYDPPVVTCDGCSGETRDPDQCRDCHRRLCAACYAYHERPCDGDPGGD